MCVTVHCACVMCILPRGLGTFDAFQGCIFSRKSFLSLEVVYDCAEATFLEYIPWITDLNEFLGKKYQKKWKQRVILKIYSVWRFLKFYETLGDGHSSKSMVIGRRLIYQAKQTSTYYRRLECKCDALLQWIVKLKNYVWQHSALQRCNKYLSTLHFKSFRIPS